MGDMIVELKYKFTGIFPASRGWCSLKREKRSLPWIENGFDLTAVHDLGRLYLKWMLLTLFADRNLSPLRLAHFFSLIPLSYVPTL